MGGISTGRNPQIQTQALQQSRPTHTLQKPSEPQLKPPQLTRSNPKSAPAQGISSGQQSIDIQTASTKILARPGNKKLYLFSPPMQKFDQSLN